jgi:hypothetical protein
VSVFWDKSAATYRDAKGKEIPYGSIRTSIETIADDARAKIRALAESYNNKAITLSDFVTGAEPIIKNSLISSSMIASGGRAQMTNALNGRLGSIVKFHLGKFREFYLAVDRGELSAAQILARADLYGAIPVRAYEEMRKGVMVDAGKGTAENFLDDGAHHCTECPGLTGRKIPIEDFPPPGSRSCGNKCRCRAEYS